MHNPSIVVMANLPVKMRPRHGKDAFLGTDTASRPRAPTKRGFLDAGRLLRTCGNVAHVRSGSAWYQPTLPLREARVHQFRKNSHKNRALHAEAPYNSNIESQYLRPPYHSNSHLNAYGILRKVHSSRIKAHSRTWPQRG